MIINTNLPALRAWNDNKKKTNEKIKIMESLSSGLRIKSAADDAAGLVISEKMRAQIRGLQQAEHNIQDGISLIQTAEGGLANILAPPLQRMRELAIQAASGTLTNEDREKIQDEVEQLNKSIDSIANNTEFNGIELLSNKREVGSIEKITFEKVNSGISGSLKDIAWNGERFVVTSASNVILSSTDGINWTQSSPEKDELIYGVTAVGDKFIMVGGAYSIEMSTDGTNWTNKNHGGAHYLFKVASDGKDNIVAIGNGGHWTSSDGGQTWTGHKLNIANVVHDIVWAGDKFINARSAIPNSFSYSIDGGETWTLVKVAGVNPKGITYGNGLIVAVGDDGDVYSSTDGISWNTHSSGITENLSDVIWDGKRFVACGEDGAVLLSEDGVNWNSAGGIQTSDKLNEMVFDGENYMVIGDNGAIFKCNLTDQSKLSENLKLQVGANSGDSMTLELPDARTDALGIDNIDVTSVSRANEAIGKIDEAIKLISSERSKFGAYQNRLEHASRNVRNADENLTASMSRITDADMAKNVMEQVKNDILVQTSQIILVQANSRPESILQMLK